MRWNEENLRKYITQAECVSDVCSLMGITSTASNYKTFHKYVQKYNLDISHFVRRTSKHKAANVSKRSCAHEDIFCENSTYDQSPLRRRVIGDKIIPYQCAVCVNMGIWCERPLTLQLDHINGVNNDHRIENLRWLCPNCHSQTSTYTGKNKRRRL